MEIKRTILTFLLLLGDAAAMEDPALNGTQQLVQRVESDLHEYHVCADGQGENGLGGGLVLGALEAITHEGNRPLGDLFSSYLGAGEGGVVVATEAALTDRQASFMEKFLPFYESAGRQIFEERPRQVCHQLVKVRNTYDHTLGELCYSYALGAGSLMALGGLTIAIPFFEMASFLPTITATFLGSLPVFGALMMETRALMPRLKGLEQEEKTLQSLTYNDRFEKYAYGPLLKALKQRFSHTEVADLHQRLLLPSLQVDHEVKPVKIFDSSRFQGRDKDLHQSLYPILERAIGGGVPSSDQDKPRPLWSWQYPTAPSPAQILQKVTYSSSDLPPENIHTLCVGQGLSTEVPMLPLVLNYSEEDAPLRDADHISSLLRSPACRLSPPFVSDVVVGYQGRSLRGFDLYKQEMEEMGPQLEPVGRALLEQAERRHPHALAGQ